MTKNLAEISIELNRQSGFDGLPNVIFITDQQAQPLPENVIENMPSGSMVILRDYENESRAELGQALRYICRAKGIKFLVAGDLTLALSLEADGIHLAEYQIKEAAAIRDEHPDFFISASCHSEEAVRELKPGTVDAILLAPIFATKTHPQTFESPELTIGTERLSNICKNCQMPIYALGGINLKTAEKLSQTGVTGIAAIRGLD